MSDFPASCIVHAPSGPVPCCDNHARALRGLYSFLGAHVAVTHAHPGDQCGNCENEAATIAKGEGKV